MSKKNKEKKSKLFWLKIFWLIILGLGLLARNTVVVLIGILLLVFFWRTGLKRVNGSTDSTSSLQARLTTGKVNKVNKIVDKIVNKIVNGSVRLTTGKVNKIVDKIVNKIVNKVNKVNKVNTIVNNDELIPLRQGFGGQAKVNNDDDGDGEIISEEAGLSDSKTSGLKVMICKNYNKMSREAADIVIEQLKKKPNSVLGLATGSTTIGMYKLLIEADKKGVIDFSQVVTFNLDEYYKIPRDDKNSYWQAMRVNLFNDVNIKEENVNIPNCESDNYDDFCLEYEDKIREAGGIDLQILGIGHNGHIGFNEPGSSFDSRTRKVDLTESTINANSRHFKDKADAPTKAITMGLGTIMEAKKIILVANGKEKAEAVAGAVREEASVDVPASVLQEHGDVIFIIDKKAALKFT